MRRPEIGTVCGGNGRRRRIEGPGSTMQPEDTHTAAETEDICRAAAHALAPNEAAMASPPAQGCQ